MTLNTRMFFHYAHDAKDFDISQFKGDDASTYRIVLDGETQKYHVYQSGYWRCEVGYDELIKDVIPEIM